MSTHPNIGHPQTISQHIRDDDVVDQLHHAVTVGIFIGLAALCGFHELAGEPIRCWNDEGDSNEWKHYQDHINAYCWSNDLYTFPDQNNRTIMPYELHKVDSPEDNSTLQINSDNSTQQINSDNSTQQIISDNSTLQINSDNSTQQINSDNSTQQINSDNSTQQIISDNSTQQIISDNSTQQINSDNTTEGIKLDSSGVDSLNADQWKITVVRWTALLFLVQALMYKVPNLMWIQFNAFSGSNVIKMQEMLQKITFCKPEKRKERILQVVFFMEKWLKMHSESYYEMDFRRVKECFSQCIEANISNCLSILYLIVKVIYLFNNLLQFGLLSSFLGVNFWSYGITAIRNFITNNEPVATTSTFPLISLCHFRVYDQGSAVDKWVQCTHPLHMYMDILFVFLWAWILMLIGATLISLSIWAFKILRTKTEVEFLANYLRISGVLTENEDEVSLLGKFVVNYLRKDGVFVLRILSSNASEVVVIELVEALWHRYIQSRPDGPSKHVKEPVVEVKEELPITEEIFSEEIFDEDADEDYNSI